MIDLYTWTTPNGRKISIFLEELGVPYEVHPVDIMADAQFTPAFLAISPNNKIPGIVDRRGPAPVAVFESGAILTYLAETTPGGEAYWSTTATGRAAINQWLMWQMAGIGPFMGRTYRFVNGREGDPDNSQWVADEFLNETMRLLRVMDGQLARTGAFLAGDAFSIADIATFPWIEGMWALLTRERPELSELASVSRWRDVVSARRAVQRGMKIPVAASG